MSLPPAFLDELRSRLSLAQVVGRKVIWDSKKTNQGKGDYWAPCPFHAEKTASFHLDDRKGFYYCFGCHAKGDALNFVRETENVGFMEAVEILAREAGMTMPARDPKAQAKADLRTQLSEVMEQAVQFFRLQLKTQQGTAAREYLEKRGLTAATQEKFEIGFTPDGRTDLFQYLTGKGVSADLIDQAGLAIKPDDGGKPFDRFRGRIMFPIRDPRGRAIAFGGRAMDPNARAKYLNSPETPLFDKGRSLYNFAPAREAAGHADALIVAEGYMDVIALTQAGFAHALAPLGTAITEQQLHLMWRIHPEPVIALDGDTAGLRAAIRLIDIALPLLEPGKSLRFCLLPEGLDPDDLIKSQGPAAMKAQIDAAKPLVELLWQRETDGKILDSPERRAALDASLKAALAKIGNLSVRNHYSAALRAKRNALFTPDVANKPFSRSRKGRREAVATHASAGARASVLAQTSGNRATDERLREAVILAAVINHQDLVATFESALEKLHLQTPGYGAVRDIILRETPDCVLKKTKIAEKLDPAYLEKLFGLRHVQISPAIAAGANIETATLALAEELAKLEAFRGAEQETIDAMQDMAGMVDEGLTWRLAQAANARNEAARAALEQDDGEYDEAKILSQNLQNLIDGQVWVKKKR